jgi:hypothetical protein
MILQQVKNCLDRRVVCTCDSMRLVNLVDGSDAPIEVDPNDRALLQEIGRLRVLAWSSFDRSRFSRTSIWLDEFEMASRHWCMSHDGEVIAAARMTICKTLSDVPDAFLYAGVLGRAPPGLVASFNRLVVHPRYRGNRRSRVLDDIRLREARIAQCGSVVCETHSGPKRIAQLVEFGFRVVGPASPYPPGHFFRESGVIAMCDLSREKGEF